MSAVAFRTAVAPGATISGDNSAPIKMSAENVRAFFGETQAVRGITLPIVEGRVTAIIGPSGCGKSTFVRCLNRMHEVTPGARVEGRILLDGADIYASSVNPVRLRRRVGMVFQKPNPFPMMSIRDNVLAGLRLTETKLDDAHARVEKALRQAALWDEVKDVLDRSGSSLSGGQQQRLCIARALALEPEVLLMDEPCSALDPIATVRIEELIHELKERYTIVIVTHNMQQAARVSGYTAFFYQGELVECDLTDTLFTKPKHQQTEDYISGRFGLGTPAPMGRHTDREYEAELTQLRENLLLMGARVEQMVHQCIRALVARDAELARATSELDREVNRLEIDTDDLCVRVLARRQPVGGDLRFVTSVLKLVTDLERMGDLCGNVCDHVVALAGVPVIAAESQLPAIGERVAEMIRDALDAFVHADAERARGVLENDRTLDAAYAALSEEVLVSIEKRPETLRAALRVQAIGRALERTGDHATNVAERVVYLVSGVDIRHKGRKQVSVGVGPRGVLFVCTDNAARSQMAEGWARKLFRGGVKIFSAGTTPMGAVDPRAIEVMNEVGVDISRQTTKRLADVPLGDVDVVVRLSDDLLPAELRRIARVESWVIRDETAAGDADAAKTAYADLRDELGRRVRALAMG